jgi:hypothetical protein
MFHGGILYDAISERVLVMTLNLTGSMSVKTTCSDSQCTKLLDLLYMFIELLACLNLGV